MVQYERFVNFNFSVHIFMKVIKGDSFGFFFSIHSLLVSCEYFTWVFLINSGKIYSSFTFILKHWIDVRIKIFFFQGGGGRRHIFLVILRCKFKNFDFSRRVWTPAPLTSPSSRSAHGYLSRIRQMNKVKFIAYSVLLV